MGDGGGSSSNVAWDELYGGGDGSSSAYGGGPPSSVADGLVFELTYTEADKALAWFRLIVSGIFLVVGTYALVLFYRSRLVLDIRTRSVHLVVIAGSAIVASYLVAVNESLAVLWGSDHSLRWFWSSMVLFFLTPITFGSYICRALRLAVVFHPRAKRALPWLIPERNYLCVLAVLATGFLVIPIHHERTLEIWEIIPKQTSILATTSLVFACCLACIFPFIRKVDDLFNISTELIAVTVLLLIQSVGLELVAEFGGEEVIRWIGKNLNFVMGAAIFGVSVVDPLRRLAFDPLAGTNWKGVDRVLLARRESGSTARTASSCISDNGDVTAADEADEEEGGRRTAQPPSRRLEAGTGPPGGGRAVRPPSRSLEGVGGGDGDGRGGRSTVGAATPAEVAAASLEAGRSSYVPPPGNLSPSPEPGAPGAGNWEYQGVSFSTQGRGAARGRAGAAGGSRGGGGEDVELWDFERLARTPLLAAAFEDYTRKALCHESVLFLIEVSRYQNGHYSDPADEAEQSQYQALCRITDLFIRPGAREEVNISGADRKRLLDWADKGHAWFSAEDGEERRLVFGKSYMEVKIMLEDNLLRRFLQTEEFKSVRALRRNVTTMLVSPPK